ncbi:hypothetical protein QBC37DRAFT_323039 [Rhypophila decipiens]|uniref:SsuA/THI5-like domain-containing protein n=1 Tax=Rhypophila decipiens TaxID=261697 RepID=A0AAN6Y243_9PEZI|nr:hypothetical protein QBC37DRAFT_323039 [Rhypophila decipiens]
MTRATSILRTAITGLLLSLTGEATANLTVAARSTLLEATPLVVAIQDYYANASSPSDIDAAKIGPATFINGLPDLWDNPTLDLDAGAEVHVLHDAPHHPDLRVITTVSEVFYRIVGAKSSGIISDPSSLKGKKIGVVLNSTSAYFAYRYLKEIAQLDETEYTLVGARGICYALPCANNSFPEMLRRGEIDAVTAYEPTTELTIQSLGAENVVVFRNDSLYRELSVMYTTQSRLDDPVTRKRIVQFLRVLEKVQSVFQNQPEQIWGRVSEITASGASAKTLGDVWPLTRWTGGIPHDMVDILYEEDKWISKDVTLGRGPMTRERVASHVYSGVLEEARALGPL